MAGREPPELEPIPLIELAQPPAPPDPWKPAARSRLPRRRVALLVVAGVAVVVLVATGFVHLLPRSEAPAPVPTASALRVGPAPPIPPPPELAEFEGDTTAAFVAVEPAPPSDQVRLRRVRVATGASRVAVLPMPGVVDPASTTVAGFGEVVVLWHEGRAFVLPGDLGSAPTGIGEPLDVSAGPTAHTVWVTERAAGNPEVVITRLVDAAGAPVGPVTMRPATDAHLDEQRGGARAAWIDPEDPTTVRVTDVISGSTGAIELPATAGRPRVLSMSPDGAAMIVIDANARGPERLLQIDVDAGTVTSSASYGLRRAATGWLSTTDGWRFAAAAPIGALLVYEPGRWYPEQLDAPLDDVESLAVTTA